ncbi:hypothetical protein O181_066790 [Austropuccinia psidii MF-1]|uniref:Uncharacterized protein n=1 Tax=Austropuccinia psidii MF-1 TaxID=1389203 RepID=A0A9Q3EXQ3_9BASI|nr:hypothetical protein [Austropuccinia psidii MF-1]
MVQLSQEAAPRDNSKAPAFKTPSMKAPDPFNGTRYHERQKEKGSHQEKKPPVTESNSSRPPQDSSRKRPPHKKKKKGKQFQVSKDKLHSALLNKENKLIGSEGEEDQRQVMYLLWWKPPN